MSPRLPYYIYLLLIIGALSVSGNAAGEVVVGPESSLPDPYPHYSYTNQSKPDAFGFSLGDFLELEISADLFSTVDDAAVDDSLEAEVVVSLPLEEPIHHLMINPESESDAFWVNDRFDSVPFFINIEKMMTVNPNSGDDDLIFVDTDPVLRSLEGDQVEGIENEPVAEEMPNLMAMETGISTAPPLAPNIPVYTNKKISAFIYMYTRKKRTIFKQAINRSGKYMKMIHRIFREYELPYNLAYLAVVESNFNPYARSRANALGMWQFMSYTGKVFDLKRSWWHDDRYDPEKSTVAAARYLKRLHRRFNGDWELALAAYNSGSGTVRRAIRRAKREGKATDFWNLKLPRETRGYVPAFYAVVTIFNDLEGYGFQERQIILDEVSKQPLEVASGISLKQIAGALSIEHEVLSEMNPSLRLRGLVPPIVDRYEISIPGEIELSALQTQKLDQLAQDRLSNWKSHTVRQGETLWSISRFYRIPVKKILAFNRFRRKNLINIGQKLMLPVATNWKAPVIVSKTKLAKKALDKLPGITHVHKVQKGDTLWKISNRYNIPIKTIKYWNRKALRRRVLKIGTEIVLKLPIDYVASTT
jgi:membrane-bound lytic murein transglycosylase D